MTSDYCSGISLGVLATLYVLETIVDATLLLQWTRAVAASENSIRPPGGGPGLSAVAPHPASRRDGGQEQQPTRDMSRGAGGDGRRTG